jgi:hypothetical protein
MISYIKVLEKYEKRQYAKTKIPKAISIARSADLTERLGKWTKYKINVLDWYRK